MSGPTPPASSNAVAGPTGAAAPAKTTATGATGPSGTTTSKTAASADSWTDSVSKFVEDITGKPMTSDTYGVFVLVFLFVLSLTVLIATGSILSVLVTWALIGLVVAVLVYYGMIDIGKKKDEAPAALPSILPSGRVGQEVFHVSQNQFTYDDAPAVCAAYGAQLATLEQIIEAYNSGAEWCGYGWSAGGMALYPTQKRTWDELQREIDPGKRTACGRPGVNGGYMDPMLKFGVNCFGFKPQGEFTPPAPVPGTDKQKFDEAVGKFKDMLNTLQLSPFSRMEWSGYDSTLAGRAAAAITPAPKAKESFTVEASGYGTQFKQDLGRLVEEFDSADPSFVEAANTVAGYNPNAPYGLRGNTGPQGLQGPQGIQGIQGPIGPMGPQGDQGIPGAQGPKGDRGADSTVPGPRGPTGERGPRGLQGPAGSASAKGDKGDRGERGLQGERGLPGPQGVAGPVGPMGPTGPMGRDSTVPGPTGPAPLRFVSAVFGSATATMDVSAAVQRSIDNGLGFMVSTGSFGRDPAPGVGKSMRVTYTPPGGVAQKTKIFAENTMFDPSALIA